MTAQDAAIRQFIYQTVVATGQVPSPLTVGTRFGMASFEAGRAFQRLQADHDALVLLPDSPYIWMAEPFSAVPTDYPVVPVADGATWYGNCVWDALSIASLAGVDADIPTACPTSGAPMTLSVRAGHLAAGAGVVHFAVKPRDWWRSIGFT